MHIDSSSIAAPGHMNFAAAKAPTLAQAETTLAKMFSTTFISDAAALFSPSLSGIIETSLNNLKTNLLSHPSLASIQSTLKTGFNALTLVSPAQPYNTAAGDALSKLITTKDTTALYAIVPAGSISASTWKSDVAALHSGLKNGQGLVELAKMI